MQTFGFQTIYIVQNQREKRKLKCELNHKIRVFTFLSSFLKQARLRRITDKRGWRIGFLTHE